MGNEADSFSRKLLSGRRGRRLLHQVLTFLAFMAPGSGARVALNKLKGAHIGHDTWIGDNVTLDVHYAHPDRAKSLIIGNRVAIGPGVKLFTHDTAFAHVTRGHHPVNFGYTVIGDDTWIGSNSVLCNCTIGKHCIITPNSLVTRNMPDYSLVSGAPAVVVRDLRPILRRAKIIDEPQKKEGEPA